MLTIDRLVLRLPDELSGRGRSLGHAIGAALAEYRPRAAQTRARVAATLHDITPGMSDAAIAGAVARAVMAELGDGAGPGQEGAAP
jgi:hypothetical protein